jgi:hypothetical protein
MSSFIKRYSVLAVFALVNSILAFILLDYFIVELKIWQYIVIETTIVAMHFLLGWIRVKVEATFPDEDEDEVV